MVLPTVCAPPPAPYTTLPIAPYVVHPLSLWTKSASSKVRSCSWVMSRARPVDQRIGGSSSSVDAVEEDLDDDEEHGMRARGSCASLPQVAVFNTRGRVVRRLDDRRVAGPRWL